MRQCGFLWEMINKGVWYIHKSMGANNRRIRRLIVDLLWENGPMTKERMADLLSQHRSVKVIPSPHTLSALLSKNTQVIIVGSEKIENIVGVKSAHAIYDIDRELIKSTEDIIFTRSPSVATPKEKQRMVKCDECGRNRVFPRGAEKCLHCIRSE